MGDEFQIAGSSLKLFYGGACAAHLRLNQFVYDVKATLPRGRIRFLFVYAER